MTNEIRRLEIRTSESGVAGSIGYLNFGIPLAFVIRASSLSDRLLTRLLLQRLGAMSEHEILFGWLSESKPVDVRLFGNDSAALHHQTHRWCGERFASSRADPHRPHLDRKRSSDPRLPAAATQFRPPNPNREPPGLAC